MKLLPFIVSSLCIIFFFDDVIFAEKKYNRVRCRDLWCNYKSRKDKEDLIKKANELRGYKEPRVPWDVRLRYLYSKTNKNDQKYDLKKLSVYKLKSLLTKLVSKEKYEKAALIRDELSKRKS